MIPFLTAGKKKELPALSQGSSVHLLWFSPTCWLTGKHMNEGSQERPQQLDRTWRVDDACFLHSWFSFHSWGAKYWWWRNFCKGDHILPLNFLSPLQTQHKGQLSSFAKMTFSFCVTGASFAHVAGSSPEPLLAAGLWRCSSQAWWRERDVWDSTHLITVANKEKLRKMREERIRNLKRVTGQVKFKPRRRKSGQNHHQTELL